MLRVAVIFSCLCSLAALEVDNPLVDKAWVAYQEQRVVDARSILSAFKHGETDLELWLRMRVALDLNDVASVDSLSEFITTGRAELATREWRPAFYQVLGENVFRKDRHEEAEVYFKIALRLGGQYIDDETILMHLMRIYYKQKRWAEALQLARVLWYGGFSSENRIRGGLVYAELIKGEAPGEARKVLVGIRLLENCPVDSYLLATEMLLGLLLPEQVEQARRIVDTVLIRYPNSDAERIRVWQSILVYGLDREQGLLLMREFEPGKYSVLGPYLSQAKRADADVYNGLIAQVEAVIAVEEYDQALFLIGDAYEKSVPLLLLALSAGIDLDHVLRHEIVYEAAPALKVYVLLRDVDPERALQVLEKALSGLAGAASLTPAQVSLFLMGMQHASPAVRLNLSVASVVSRFDEKHAALGMWCCQRAQEKQAIKDVGQAFYWGLALKYLPLEHPWFVSAAEQLALSGLEPLSPGERLMDPTKQQSERLDRLIESLSFIAWAGEAGVNLRCRYLLAQALSQRGDVGEARLCFTSLLGVADDSRKIRLNKALHELSQQGQAFRP